MNGMDAIAIKTRSTSGGEGEVEQILFLVTTGPFSMD
jgi:hypothetical protein